MEARIIDGVPIVTTTDVRNHLSTILDKVLGKYDKVIIEQKGKPVAMISVLTNGDGISVESF